MHKSTAKIENGIVTQVIAGYPDWASQKLNGMWMDVSGLRVGIGYTYTEAEGFRPPKPHEMAYWDDNEGRWIIPDEYLPPEPEGIDGI